MSPRNNSPGALYAFAHVAAKLEDLERSRELLEETLAQAPDNDNAALSYISILQRLGREQEALAWLEQQLAKREENDFNLRMGLCKTIDGIQAVRQGGGPIRTVGRTGAREP